MLDVLQPRETLSEEEARRGLRPLLLDGVCSQAMGVLTGGAFLVAFALLLGASNRIIGLLAAIGPFTQILQIPAIFLVDRTRLRKALVVVGSFFARALWLLVAALPWFFPQTWRLPIFLVSLFVFFSLGSIATCAFSSWMRDLVPEKIMGSYFARRLAAAVAVGAALSLLAGFAVDLYKRAYPQQEIAAYSFLFVVGAVWGLVGLFFLSRVPEPRMTPAPSQGLLAILGQPFRDTNFRSLLVFLGLWNFAVNLAAPFFAVYMFRRLGMSISLIIVLSVASQFVNVLFFPVWGRLADRFTNKSALTVAGPLFIVSIVLWPFLTMPERHVLTVPLLVVIHVLGGISSAGVALCAGNIALKAAPKGAATSYLATNALVSGLAATAAPILGGFLGDWFAARELSLTLNWGRVGGPLSSLPAVNLRGLDFLFVVAFVLGLYALHRLLAVREEGEVEERIVITQLYAEVRRAVRHVSNIAGVRHLTHFPYARLKDLLAGKETEGPAAGGPPGEPEPRSSD